jgi:hypothetical protein
VKKISKERGKAVKQEQLEKKQGTFMSEERGKGEQVHLHLHQSMIHH